jgi:type II secretory pathway pseudopilin PulG
MSNSNQKQDRKTVQLKQSTGVEGFSLLECVIALVVLMVMSLGVVSVFDFSVKYGQSGRKRFAALLLAEQRSEDVRYIPFKDLTAGAVTLPSVVYDGQTYQIVQTTADNDLIIDSDFPGPERKQITISVSPFGGATMPGETVTLVTYRAKTIPGVSREANSVIP